MKPKRKTSAHYYFDTGEKWPRVTRPLDCSPKEALQRWKVNTEREYVIEAAANLYEEMISTGFKSRPGMIAALNAQLDEEKAHARKAREAADIGTEAHALIEWTLRRGLIPVDDEVRLRKLGPGPVLSQPALTAFSSWESWRATRRLEPLYIEQTVWSRDLEIAGTLDLLSQFFLGIGYEPMFGFHDWKTSGNVYVQQKIQVAVYRHCFLEMAREGLIDAGPVREENSLGVIVRLAKKGEPDFAVEYVHPHECDQYVQIYRHLRAVHEFFIERKGELPPQKPKSFREAVDYENSIAQDDDPFAGLVETEPK